MTIQELQLLFDSVTMSHHSYLTIFSLPQNNQMRRIQTPLTHLQSSHNHPTFISV